MKHADRDVTHCGAPLPPSAGPGEADRDVAQRRPLLRDLRDRHSECARCENGERTRKQAPPAPDTTPTRTAVSCTCLNGNSKFWDLCLLPPPPPGASRFTTSLYLTASEEGQHSVTAAAVAAATAATAAGSPRGGTGTTGGDSAAESAFAHSAWVAEAAAAGVAAASGVEVTFTVRCGAGLPWPMNQVGCKCSAV